MYKFSFSPSFELPLPFLVLETVRHLLVGVICCVSQEPMLPSHARTLTNPPAIPPAARRRSNVVKEVDRIQKKREERRKQQAEKKEEKEALMNLDPGNPQWEFLNMIREFR